MKKILNSLRLTCVLILIGVPLNFTAQSGMRFDDVNDYVSVPNASALIAGSTSMSLSFWVYPENATAGFPDFDGIAGIRNNVNADFYLLQLSASNVEARFRNSAGTAFTMTFTGLNLNQWNHFVMSYTGTALMLYHNGVNVLTIPANGTISNTTVPLEIGRTFFTNATSSFYLDGKLDNVALWNIGLIAGDVSSLYNNTCSHDLSDPSLVLCYEFTEGVINGNNTSIPSLYDGKGNINGVFNGIALTGTTSNYDLGVSPSNTASTISASTCGPYTSPAGNTYLAPGVFSDTLPNSFGCDSIITIILTDLVYQTTIFESECVSYTTPSGGATYTSSGIYTDVLSSVGGCDSVITINLTIATTQTSINETACVSYTTPSGNATYSVAGIYNDTLTSIGGCDSILIINLTFPTYQSTITETACTSYTSPSGVTYTSSGTYTEMLQSTTGCDSLVTINLTIAGSASSISETACDSYTVPSGNATYSTSGIYSDTLTNMFGCDSVLTIDLTVNSLDIGIQLAVTTLISNQTSGTYQWIDCSTNTAIVGETNQSFIPTVNGFYAVILSSGSCVDTTACFEYNYWGISEEALFNNLTVFPNPVSDNFTIEFGTAFEQISIEVTNLAGQEIMVGEFADVNKVDLSMSNFENGIYFVNVSVGNAMKSIKVIKE